MNTILRPNGALLFIKKEKKKDNICHERSYCSIDFTAIFNPVIKPDMHRGEIV